MSLTLAPTLTPALRTPRPDQVLVNLRLGENALDVKSAHVLARLLEGNQTLTSLDLRDNDLGDAGAAVLGAALRRNAGLQCLVL